MSTMTSRPEAASKARSPLSRERVLATAIDLADEGGIEALTMRRLAQALGVEAMTLYYYVANKDDLLDGMVDVVVGEIELPAMGPAWRPALRRTAISAHETLVRHPWAAALMLSPGAVRPSRLRYMNAILGCLRGGGFSAVMTHHAYHALDSHILGFTLWQVAIMRGVPDLPDAASSLLAELPAAEYPHLAEHIRQHLGDRDDREEGEFEFGLDLILGGLERLLSP
jgi:AcrR family transcriptional regulator